MGKGPKPGAHNENFADQSDTNDILLSNILIMCAGLNLTKKAATKALVKRDNATSKTDFSLYKHLNDNTINLT